MGVSLYYGYYPNKCNDTEIIKFLSIDDNSYCNGKRLSASFYENCRELSAYDEDAHCYIFTDTNKLFEFASSTETPADTTDFITENYRENQMFIIWVR